MSELWRRLGFVALALLVYRIGTHIPIPGINPEQVAALFQQSQGTILQYFNLFSGGALERMSIFALSVVPYISAAIVMQLFSNSVPYLSLCISFALSILTLLSFFLSYKYDSLYLSAKLLSVIYALRPCHMTHNN